MYAVHQGREPGIYESWEKARASVSGFSGAVYRKCSTRADAAFFVTHGRLPRRTSPAAPSAVDGIHVFTDGSFSKKTRRSGLGVYFAPPHSHLSASRRLEDGTTNQRAELEAVIAALKALARYHPGQRATVWTDSGYVCDCLRRYVPRWLENGWRTAADHPVKYAGRLQTLWGLAQSLPFASVRHISEAGVKAHMRAPDVPRDALAQFVHRGNAEADALALGRALKAARKKC